jgi:hypothetical protein
MNGVTRSIVATILTLAVTSASAQSLSLEQLLGVWAMSYDMGQGAQTGTITVSRDDSGGPKIMMSTTGGGDSEARDIKIEDGKLMFTRDVSAQGQNLSVSYTAMLVDGKLDGSFEVDLGALGGAAGGLGGPTAWEATKAE